VSTNYFRSRLPVSHETETDTVTPTMRTVVMAESKSEYPVEQTANAFFTGMPFKLQTTPWVAH